MYKMKFMWRCTLCHCDTQIYDDNNVPMHFVPLWHTGIRWTQSTLTHSYHLIHVCHNDTEYIDTLLSSHTCVSQWYKVQWHIVIILYLCVTMTQSTSTHCNHLIPVCHNGTKCIGTLLVNVLCVIVTHMYKMITMCQCTLCHCDTHV
jgi:hypothetical protein